MHKVSRFDITENKIACFVKEGRGRGKLAELDNLATLISDFEDKLLFLERKNQSECKLDIKNL